MSAIVIGFLIFEMMLLTIVLFLTLANDISYCYFVFANVSDVFNLYVMFLTLVISLAKVRKVIYNSRKYHLQKKESSFSNSNINYNFK
jgi:hypothetical protein